MSKDFSSFQSVTIEGPSGDGVTAEFEIELECISPSFGGYFNPITGDGEGPCGAEFDVGMVYLIVPSKDKKRAPGSFDHPLSMTWEQFEALVGEDIADDLFGAACQDAMDAGGF